MFKRSLVCIAGFFCIASCVADDPWDVARNNALDVRLEVMNAIDGIVGHRSNILALQPQIFEAHMMAGAPGPPPDFTGVALSLQVDLTVFGNGIQQGNQRIQEGDGYVIVEDKVDAYNEAKGIYESNKSDARDREQFAHGVVEEMIDVLESYQNKQANVWADRWTLQIANCFAG